MASWFKDVWTRSKPVHISRFPQGQWDWKAWNIMIAVTPAVLLGYGVRQVSSEMQELSERKQKWTVFRKAQKAQRKQEAELREFEARLQAQLDKRSHEYPTCSTATPNSTTASKEGQGTMADAAPINSMTREEIEARLAATQQDISSLQATVETQYETLRHELKELSKREGQAT